MVCEIPTFRTLWNSFRQAMRCSSDVYRLRVAKEIVIRSKQSSGNGTADASA